MSPRWKALIPTLVPMALALTLALALTSCSDDSTAPKPAELAGTWTATKVEYVSKTSSARVDLIAAGGSASLVLTEDRRFQYVETPHGGTPDTLTGTWSVSSDVMTFVIEGMNGERQFDYSFSASSLVLTGGDAPYDFGAGAGMEDTKQNLAFTR
jgi:hypothetical protein